MNLKSQSAAVALALVANVSNAGLIDFEDAAQFGGDNTAISDQYMTSHGVTFSMMAGKTKNTASSYAPSFEQSGHYAGDLIRGFASKQAGTDGQVGNKSSLGDYFLTSSAGLTKQIGYIKLTVDYAQAVSAASGEIWDIDGNRENKTEQFSVTAFDENGGVVATLLSPRGSEQNLDAQPWVWSVDPGQVFSKIEIEFVGTKTGGTGLAFDNFNTSQANIMADAHATPLPSSLGMGLIGLAGLALRRRHAKKKNAVV